MTFVSAIDTGRWIAVPVAEESGTAAITVKPARREQMGRDCSGEQA